LKIRLIRLRTHSEVKKIVHRVSEVLLAAEIAFRRLHGCMPQQELNLLQLAPARVAQLRTGSPQVMRRNMLQARSLATGLDHVPDNILRDAVPPHLFRPSDGSEDPSLRDPGRYGPLIKRCFNPSWNRDGANVAALADQIHHCPVPLAHLDFIQLQAHKFRPAKTTTKQHGQHCVVALGSHAIATRMLQHC
jgi:hypothetical protein